MVKHGKKVNGDNNLNLEEMCITYLLRDASRGW
jgi:hypothetical protein